MSLARLSACVAVLALASGCVEMRPLSAAPKDYAAYRSTRIAPSLGARLAAAQRYLEAFPAGDFAADVRSYFEVAEPLFYASKKDSVAGLTEYLRWLPDGPNGEIAAYRLTQLRVARVQKDGLSGVADALERKMAAASKERAEVRSQVASWVARLSAPTMFQRPLVEATGELLVAWTLQIPRPRCQPVDDPRAPLDFARRCSKLLELSYVIPVGGESTPRQATIEVAIIEDGLGRPRQVTVGGPELFSRIEEARSVKALASGDAGARAAAIEGVMALVREAVPSCSQTAPLEVTCPGARIAVRAGGGADDDQIVIGEAAL